MSKAPLQLETDAFRTEAKALGDWLADLRRGHGLKRSEVAVEAEKFGYELTPDYYSKFERGERHLLQQSTLETRQAIRLGLRISQEAWKKRTKILAPATRFDASMFKILDPESPDGHSTQLTTQPLGDIIALPDLGLVAAANLENITWPVHPNAGEYHGSYSVTREAINGYNPDDLFKLTADGLSMVSDEVRNTISPGTPLICHRFLEPEQGDIVIVWLDDHEMGIVKEYWPKRTRDIVLRSWNNDFPPITLRPGDRWHVQGVVISWVTIRRQHGVKRKS